MKVLYPSRIVNGHVGGNTTYARAIRDGIARRGVETGLIPAGRHAAITALLETAYGAIPRKDTILHYTADTGSLLPSPNQTVLTVHGVASRWINTARKPLQERIWRKRVARGIAVADAILSVSETGADDVSEVFGLDRAQVRVIPHGIDVEHFARRVILTPELAAILPDEFALYLGNIEPRKNLVELVEAFGRPSLRTAGLTLVVAGRRAWNYDASMAAIEGADNVIYLDFVSDEDRVALMQSCRLFVFPSLYEGFGLPVLEALAAGAPVVCSSEGALREFAGPSMIMEGTDRVSIEAAVVRALSDQDWLSSLPVRASAWLSRFSWDESISAHLAVYNDLARSRP